MQEMWKDIPGYSGKYQISNLGRVLSFKRHTPRYLKPKTQPSTGKLCVQLSDGSSVTKCIHTLVAEAFIGPRPKGLVIRHLDGDKTNNKIDNLAYGTHKENIADAIKHGTHFGHNRRVLTDDQVRLVRSRQEPLLVLAKRFGVSRHTLYDCVNRITYQNIH